ncbi:MAG: AAA family ATPase [Granulosicoccus sp.]
MIHTLAVSNYRSLLRLVLPLDQLTIITGANGSGKSNLYRALRLLADTAQGGVIPSLAQEGGLESTLWAGPEKISKKMRSGEVPVQGGPRTKTVKLRLGFNSNDFGYAIDLGLPAPTSSAFHLDPEIKREVIWSGPHYRTASCLVDRKGPLIKVRNGRTFKIVTEHIPLYESMFGHLADPVNTPEIYHLREYIRDWRFYDQFRTDRDAPARQPQLGTRTPVLSHDGADVAAAIQTIREIGETRMLDEAVDDAFPGAMLGVTCSDDSRFRVQFTQPGLLRTLDASELSDGTLRYLLWIAALLTPRPPSLMVLNEPETSLHPDLLPALARLIVRASERSQIWIVSHAQRLINALEESADYHSIELQKDMGQTLIRGQRDLDEPSWHWPTKN